MRHHSWFRVLYIDNTLLTHRLAASSDLSPHAIPARDCRVDSRGSCDTSQPRTSHMASHGTPPGNMRASRRVAPFRLCQALSISKDGRVHRWLEQQATDRVHDAQLTSLVPVEGEKAKTILVQHGGMAPLDSMHILHGVVALGQE